VADCLHIFRRDGDYCFPINFLSIYVFHDVDKDRIGQWNLAFLELCLEFGVFALVATGIFLLFLWLGRMVLRMSAISSNYLLAFLLGVFLILAQYPIEFLGRLFLPSRQDTVLISYLLLSPVLCSALFLRNSFAKLRRTG
jgi:hypothetical protein